jgi:hypothetical protein
LYSQPNILFVPWWLRSSGVLAPMADIPIGRWTITIELLSVRAARRVLLVRWGGRIRTSEMDEAEAKKRIANCQGATLLRVDLGEHAHEGDALFQAAAAQ